MNVTIQPSLLSGTIHAPASKSSMQRACAAALVSQKKCTILNPGKSNDDKAALSIIESLGATIQWNNNDLVIDSTHLNKAANAINCGESGLSIRMFTPIAALNEHTITINGDGSLAKRPMDFFDEILPQLGVQIKSNDGKLPLQITGTLKPKNITVDGSMSSQFLTGLLLAYTAADANDVSIQVTNLKSKPYIDLTLDVMKQFGLTVPLNKNYEAFIFTQTNKLDKSEEILYSVESDWSGGAFLLVAGAIAGTNITISGLDMMSTQADKKICEALMNANAAIAFESKHIKLHQAALQAFEFDASDCPDLFPPLVALAAYCNGITKIKGTSRLTHKESDRAVTLQQEFGKMNVQIDLEGDYMYVHGGGVVKGAIVTSHHDHRIAMACAVAALRADGETVIEQAEAINKSYPDFYLHLKELKATVSLYNLKTFISE